MLLFSCNMFNWVKCWWILQWWTLQHSKYSKVGISSESSHNIPCGISGPDCQPPYQLPSTPSHLLVGYRERERECLYVGGF